MATLSDLSIIIPAFNAAGVIEPTLRSLEAAGAGRVREIIIVDDGSSDSTTAIAWECRKFLPNIRVIKRPHAGAGAARNAGVAASRGKYVHFVNAGDGMALDAYMVLEASLLAEPDMVDFDRWRTSRISAWRHETSMSEDALHGYRATEYAVIASGFLTCKIMARRVVIALPFPELKYHSDLAVLAVLPFHCKSIRRVRQALYLLRNRATRSSRKTWAERVRCLRAATAIYCMLAEEIGIMQRYPQASRFQEFRMFANMTWRCLLRGNGIRGFALAREHSREVSDRFPDIFENPWFRDQAFAVRCFAALLLRHASHSANSTQALMPQPMQDHPRGTVSPRILPSPSGTCTRNG